MDYLKLIVIDVQDMMSSIYHEENFSLDAEDEAKTIKKEYTQDGFVCVLIKITSGFELN